MPKEVERKFLIKKNNLVYATSFLFQLYSSVELLKDDVLAAGENIQQGYLPLARGMELALELDMEKVDFEPVEARLRDADGTFTFALKGAGSLSRDEVETPITKETFNRYWLYTNGRRIRKVRLKRLFNQFTLEIDVYTDRELVIAEVEGLSREHLAGMLLIGLDVSNDKRYKNQNLAK